MRAYNKVYNATPKARAARAMWAKTPKARANRQRHEQRKRWPRWIKKTYGITVEEYAWMLHDQNFLCPICGKRFSFQIISAKTQSRTTRPCVDHNHETGSVRGLVCGWCNYGLLGPIERSGITRLLNALSYLGFDKIITEVAT